MRQALHSLCLGIAVAGGASAQLFQGYYAAFPPQPTPSSVISPALTATEIPMWGYSVTAGADLGGAVYNGSIIGRSPMLRGKTTTTIPLQIVPVILTINNGAADTH